MGHIFQGRFKAILIQRESHLLELCRYVVLNPVRTGTVHSPEAYLWSSYRGTAGLEKAEPFLTVDWIIGQRGTKRSQAKKRYRQFVGEGIRASSPWEELHGGVILGSERFLKAMEPLLEDKTQAHRLLSQLFYGYTHKRKIRQRPRVLKGVAMTEGDMGAMPESGETHCGVCLEIPWNKISTASRAIWFLKRYETSIVMPFSSVG